MGAVLVTIEALREALRGRIAYAQHRIAGVALLAARPCVYQPKTKRGSHGPLPLSDPPGPRRASPAGLAPGRARAGCRGCTPGRARTACRGRTGARRPRDRRPPGPAAPRRRPRHRGDDRRVADSRATTEVLPAAEPAGRSAGAS